MQRRNRLSRSRDFDAVYRHGRSTSTRFLVLYWFDRGDEPGEPRLGLAVPKAAGNAVARNRIKRQLREIWRARLDHVPGGRWAGRCASRYGLRQSLEAAGLVKRGRCIRERLIQVNAAHGQARASF